MVQRLALLLLSIHCTKSLCLVEKMKKEGALAYLQNYRISIGVESVIFCDLYLGAISRYFWNALHWRDQGSGKSF